MPALPKTDTGKIRKIGPRMNAPSWAGAPGRARRAGAARGDRASRQHRARRVLPDGAARDRHVLRLRQPRLRHRPRVPHARSGRATSRMAASRSRAATWSLRTSQIACRCTGRPVRRSAGLGLEGTIDAMVCNPPTSPSQARRRPRALLENEPREAFDGGPYGLASTSAW